MPLASRSSGCSFRSQVRLSETSVDPRRRRTAANGASASTSGALIFALAYQMCLPTYNCQSESFPTSTRNCGLRAHLGTSQQGSNGDDFPTLPGQPYVVLSNANGLRGKATSRKVHAFRRGMLGFTTVVRANLLRPGERAGSPASHTETSPLAKKAQLRIREAKEGARPQGQEGREEKASPGKPRSGRRRRDTTNG